MLTVHHLNNSRSQRIIWLLEELGVDYQIKSYQRDPVTSLAPSELEAVHPLGKSPVLTDGEVTVIESGAIIDFCCAIMVAVSYYLRRVVMTMSNICSGYITVRVVRYYR